MVLRLTEPANIMVTLIIIQLLIGLAGVTTTKHWFFVSRQLEEQLAISGSTVHFADRVRQGEWRATGRSQRGDAKTLDADNEHPLPAAIDALSRLWIRLNLSLLSQYECE